MHLDLNSLSCSFNYRMQWDIFKLKSDLFLISDAIWRIVSTFCSSCCFLFYHSDEVPYAWFILNHFGIGYCISCQRDCCNRSLEFVGHIFRKSDFISEIFFCLMIKKRLKAKVQELSGKEQRSSKKPGHRSKNIVGTLRKDNWNQQVCLIYCREQLNHVIAFQEIVFTRFLKQTILDFPVFNYGELERRLDLWNWNALLRQYLPHRCWPPWSFPLINFGDHLIAHILELVRSFLTQSTIPCFNR